MLTKELIALLKEADPEGNTEVCIDNLPVWYVQKLPAYYDGCMIRYTPSLTQDHFTHVEKMERVQNGSKIDICYYSWKSAMWDSDGELELKDGADDSFIQKVEQERVRVLSFIKNRKNK